MIPEPNAEESPQGLGPALHDFSGVEQAPEFYSDALNVNLGVYGMTIQFGTRAVSEGGSRSRLHGVLHLSPQLAKVLAAILTKQIRAYEKDIGRISIPPEIVRATQIVDEIKALEVKDDGQ